MNHLYSSVEEIRQMRLAYFSRTQLHEPTPTAPEGKFFGQKYETDSLQHYQGNNRSSSNVAQSALQVRAHSLISDGAWENEILSSRISDNSERFWFKSVSVQEISRFGSIEHFPHARSPSPDEEVDLNYNVLGLATPRAGSSVRRGQVYNKGGGIHRQEQMKMAEELFSPQTLEKMRAALGEEGLHQVLIKIADNLQKFKKGEAAGQDGVLTEMRERVHDDSFLEPNTEVSSRLFLRQSPQTPRGSNPQSSHGMPSPVTKNLSLKIDEQEVDIPARHFSQFTVSSSQRNTVSTDNAYKHFQPNSEQCYQNHYRHINSEQCYQNHYRHINSEQCYQNHYRHINSEQCYQNHYRHINSEHLYHHRQARQEHLSPSDNSSRFQINQLPFIGTLNKPALPVLSNLHGASHLKTWSGSSKIHFINSPFNPSLPLIPHPMFQSLHYPTSFNANPPTESQMSGRWVEPQVFSGEAQTAFDMHCYPLPNRRGVPELAFFPTPFHQSPTAPGAGFNQPLLPPLSPAPSRRDEVSHLVSGETQIASHITASFSQQMHSSLTPGVSSPLPALSSQHRLGQDRDTSSNQQPLYSNSREYNLHRFFSSLEGTNTIYADSSFPLPVNLSESQRGDLSGYMDAAESEGTEVAICNAGGVTQRLNDLDIDLDQLKHLRVHDSYGSAASGDLGASPKGVRSCPECRSSNKAYMSWCTECGEVLVGIEPVYPKGKIKRVSLEKRKDEGRKVEATKVEATKVGATKVGATKVGATKVGATKVEATKVGATKVGATKVGATKVEATKVEVTKVEATKVEATKVEATKVEATKVEATKVEATKVEVTKVEATKVEATKVYNFLLTDKIQDVKNSKESEEQSDGSLESSNSLSASVSSVVHQEWDVLRGQNGRVQDYSTILRGQRNPGKDSNAILIEEDLKPSSREDNCDQENNPDSYNEIQMQFEDKKSANADVYLFEEMKDPVLRGIILLWRNRQQLQTARTESYPKYREANVMYKNGGNSRENVDTSTNGGSNSGQDRTFNTPANSRENVDTSTNWGSNSGQDKTFNTPANSRENVDTSTNGGSNSGQDKTSNTPANSRENVDTNTNWGSNSGQDKTFNTPATRTAHHKSRLVSNPVEIYSLESQNNGGTTLAHHVSSSVGGSKKVTDQEVNSKQEPQRGSYQHVRVSRSANKSLPENKVEIMDDCKKHSHIKTQTSSSFEEGGRKYKAFETDSTKKDFLMEMSKAMNKRSTGERLMDVKIFGYDKTLRSVSQARDKDIVPTLELACPSDEEEEDNDAVDKNVSGDGLAMNSGPRKIQEIVNQPPEDSCEKNLTIKVSKQRPINRIHASPSKSSFSQSEVLLPKRSQMGASGDMPKRSQMGASGDMPKRSQMGASGDMPNKRHWARSSIAWGSFKPRELSTRSSLTNLTYRNGLRQSVTSASVLAPNNLQSESQHEIAMNFDIPETNVSQRPSSADDSHRQMATKLSQRPSSANLPSRNGRHFHPSTEFAESGLPRAVLERCSVPGVPKEAISENNSRLAALTTGCPEDLYLTPAKTEEPAPPAGAASASSQSDSPRLLCARLHRLPYEEAHTDQLHVLAKSAYEKFQEMTPRVAEGVISLWQCLPDELWIFIFNFLSHGDLISLMQVSRYFNRLANDETLWRYVTVKPRYKLTDTALAIIASHRPLSLAMVKCQGHSLGLDALRDFFRETQGRLQELNICGCSQGSLVGSVLLVTAGEYCQRLTHLDASFCQLNDEAFLAIINCSVRLESVCVNGFQSMSDVCLLALLRKHGKSLRTLELYACFSLSAFAFHSIGEFCTNLRRLCLGSCSKLTDSVMSSLSTHLNQIQELDLRGCKNLWDDCIRKIVRNCPCIHTLILANCNQISDAGLTEIATYLKPTLRVLDVCGCNRISDHGLANLARNCSQLTSLDISSTSCTIISVQQLTNSACSKVLESVRLSFLSRLTEACLLNLIQRCPRLTSIHVFGCSSLRSLANLQKANPNLSVEADIKESTLS